MIMKHLSLLLVIMSQCLFFSVYAQNTMHYTYDDAGNRTSRIQISTRSFTPSVQNINEQNISKELSEMTVNVYPNPVISELTISINELPEKNNWKLLLYDISGKLVYQKDQNTIETTVSMSNYPSGVYIVKLIFNETQSIWKITKQ